MSAEASFERLSKLHDEVSRGAEALLRAGRAVVDAEGRKVEDDVAAAVEYCEGTLRPYLSAAEFTLYPAVNGVLGNMDATRVMIAQHETLRAMLRDLSTIVDAAAESPNPEQYRSYLAPLLLGAYGMARGHLESEADVYLPLLEDFLSESQIDVIVENFSRLTQQSASATS